MVVHGLVEPAVCFSELLACKELIHSCIRQNPNNIILRQQTFVNIYEWKISIYDIYNSQWPFYHLTFKCDLDIQRTWTNVSNEQLCQIILKSMRKCRSYGMTSSIYNLFIIWPSSVTLTFNLHEQMPQTALLLLKRNNWIKLFWNPCINDSYDLYKLNLLPFYQLTFKCDLDLQPVWRNVSNGTATLQGEQLCQIILKSIYKCRSYGPYKLYFWPFYYLTF